MITLGWFMDTWLKFIAEKIDDFVDNIITIIIAMAMMPGGWPYGNL